MNGENPSPSLPRQLACARCGKVFACGLGVECWCMAEPYRLPVFDTVQDCLCPDCLRKAAQETGVLPI